MSEQFPMNSTLARRSFISRSIAFGAGVGIWSSTANAAGANPAVECQASAADSLVLYLDLLRNVESEAFVEAANQITAAAKNCYTTLDELYEKLQLLQAELRSTRALLQIREMQNAVEVGKAQVDIARTSFAHARRTPALLVQTLTLVRDQVNRTAQDLLPPGRITLSPKAKKLLEDMLDLVRDAHEVPQQTRNAVDDHQKRVDEIAKLTNSIRDELFAASSAAADADLSNSPAEALQGKTKAAGLIDSACTKLAQLKPARAGARPTTAKLGSADLLIKILTGTKQSLGALNSSLREKGGVKFVSAGFVDSPAAMPSNYSRVQAALDAHCPRGTPFRTLHCLGLILGPLAYPDADTRIPLISGVLVLFPCGGGDRAGLASTLAMI